MVGRRRRCQVHKLVGGEDSNDMTGGEEVEFEDSGGEIDEESEAEECTKTGARESTLSAGAGVRVGATLDVALGVGRDGGIDAVFIRHSKDLAFQLIKGFSLSRKGIPKIMDCMPMGATKKVSCNETSDIEYENMTIPEQDKVVAPSARVT